MVATTSKDVRILRQLTQQYVEQCAETRQNELRDAWRKQNSLKRKYPLVYVTSYAWEEMPMAECKCEDPLFREVEDFLRLQLFRKTFCDDSIFEPWVTLKASYACSGWGVECDCMHSEEQGGAYKVNYPLKDLEDIENLKMPRHEIDEEKTAENYAKLHDAIGDLITINLDRGPAYQVWSGDLATDLGFLRGIENFMMDMILNPDWLHRLVGFMALGVSKTHDQAEAQGDWGLGAHDNQGMCYCEELPDPAPNQNGMQRKDLWCYMAAQELTAVSPAMHDEFMLQYQIPILSKFGAVAYGCCEDLTQKISIVRQIPNLRRIAVTPFADAVKCAEQIGSDYVSSYRPSPADMVSYGFDTERIHSILTRDLEAFKANDCTVDICLKDVHTVGKDPERIKNWVSETRKVISEQYD